MDKVSNFIHLHASSTTLSIMGLKWDQNATNSMNTSKGRLDTQTKHHEGLIHHPKPLLILELLKLQQIKEKGPTKLKILDLACKSLKGGT